MAEGSEDSKDKFFKSLKTRYFFYCALALQKKRILDQDGKVLRRILPEVKMVLVIPMPRMMKIGLFIQPLYG